MSVFVFYSSIVSVAGLIVTGICIADEKKKNVRKRQEQKVKDYELNRRIEKMNNEINPRKIKNIDMADYF